MNSGYGIIEAVAFLKQATQSTAITLLVHEKPGNPPQGVAVYLWNYPQVQMRPTLLPEQRQPGDEQETAYFIYPFTTFPQDRFMRENPDFRKVWSFVKPDGKDSVGIFKRTGG